MTDYVDLITTLRNEAELARFGVAVPPVLCEQAADAIEDLIAALNASNDVIAKSRSKWISVEDRLPDLYDAVIISIATKNGFDKPTTVETIGGYDHKYQRWEQYTAPNRQLCKGERVTHWMSLPEPPKEET